MTTLSERLGLEPAEQIIPSPVAVEPVDGETIIEHFQRMWTAGFVEATEADRRATVEAVRKYLLTHGGGAELLTRGETDELIRELLKGGGDG